LELIVVLPEHVSVYKISWESVSCYLHARKLWKLWMEFYSSSQK